MNEIMSRVRLRKMVKKEIIVHAERREAENFFETYKIRAPNSLF